MSQTKGLEDYLNRWFQGELSGDVMMPSKVAVAMVLNVMLGKLDAQALGDKPQLDLCVSHDMTVYTVRHGSGLEPIAAAAVEFLTVCRRTASKASCCCVAITEGLLK